MSLFTSSTSIAVLDSDPPSARGLAVEGRGIVKEYGTGETRVQALRGVDLEIPRGEMSLLVGPSGCGKTTLISIVAGLLEPTRGEIAVLGESLVRMSNSRKVKFRGRNIGFVFQQYNLLPALTAAENAAIPLLAAGMRRKEAVERGASMLAEVGLGNRVKSRPSELSGGQQQRVAIARALVHEPRLLVCDEPTAALDAHSGQVVMELLRKVAVHPERAVIVVTHDSRVYRFGNRIIEMSDGHIENTTVQEPS
jgi:putative ABC transport system ATP-binding protein